MSRTGWIAICVGVMLAASAGFRWTHAQPPVTLGEPTTPPTPILPRSGPSLPGVSPASSSPPVALPGVSAPGGAATVNGVGSTGSGLTGTVTIDPTTAPGFTFPNGTHVYETGEFLLAVSKTGKSVWGYSTRVGDWRKFTLERPVEGLSAFLLTDNLAVLVQGKKAYAFSGIKGEWSLIDLAGPGTPVAGNGRVRIEVGSRVYVYSAQAARWSSIDLRVD